MREKAINKKKIEVRLLKRVYVWELPVRIFHWVNAGCITALIITGILIAYPLPIISSKDASHAYIMGWTRSIHFTVAYIFVANFIVRIYWGFVGNKYARWYQFIPSNKKRIAALWKVIRAEVLMVDNRDHQNVGHNALAGFTYFLVFIGFVVQTITGFGLYANNATWFFPKLFTWVGPFLGGDYNMREIHHWSMWFFILFTVGHIYLVFFQEYIEGNGEISSMGSGYKFVYSDNEDKDALTKEEREFKKDKGRDPK